MAVRGLGIAMAVFTLANPIMLGVAALAAAGLLIYKNWEPLVAFFERLGESLKGFGQYVGGGANAGLANVSGGNLPVAPAPQGLAGFGASGLSGGAAFGAGNTTVNVGDIHIETQATDAREIAGTVSQEIQEQSQAGDGTGRYEYWWVAVEFRMVSSFALS